MPRHSTPEDDAFFLDMVRPHWLARLEAQMGTREQAELLLDAIESSLRSICEVYEVSVQDTWCGLIGGYTEAMTRAYLRGSPGIEVDMTIPRAKPDA